MFTGMQLPEGSLGKYRHCNTTPHTGCSKTILKRMFSALSEGKTTAKMHAVYSVLIILEHKVAATPGRDNMEMYR